jgi:hypothetical protein
MSYPIFKLSELRGMFGGRYVVDGDDGPSIVTPSLDDLLFFSTYIFRGIFGGIMESDVLESLEQYSRLHAMGSQPKVIATDEEKLAIGEFVIDAIVFVLTSADLVSAGLKSGESRYPGQ